MRSTKYLPALRQISKQQITKRATPGERVMSSLFARGSGWPTSWSTDRYLQVQHLRNWTYVTINTLAMKMASIMPNMAWVTDETKPGLTQKACDRMVPTLRGQYAGTQTVDGVGVAETYSKVHSGLHFSDGGHSYLTMGAYRSKALSVVKPHEELEPLEADHDLRRILSDPNPQDTAYDLLYELDMFLELCGIAYLWAVPNAYGKPAELWVLPSHWVWPYTGGGRHVVNPIDHPHAEELIEYYTMRPWGTTGNQGALFIPPNEILCFRRKSPLSKLDGYSPLFASAQWIDSEESITASRWSQFQNQARPELVIELAEGMSDPTADMIARYEAMFRQRFMGEYNYGKPIFLGPGAKVTPLGYNPTEMAYFQSEEQIRDQLLSTFNMPPSAVGIVKDMTFGSILATLMALCGFCINPRLVMMGQVLTKRLGKHWDEEPRSWSTRNGAGGGGSARKCRIWYDDCVPADPAQVNADIDTDLRGYGITPDELRALRGRKPLPRFGNVPWVQGPGGPMPMPIDDMTGDQIPMQQAVERLAADVAPLVQAEGEADEQSPDTGAPMLGKPDEEQTEGPSAVTGLPAGSEEYQDREEASPAVEEPNGPPSKAKGYRKVSANVGDTVIWQSRTGPVDAEFRGWTSGMDGYEATIIVRPKEGESGSPFQITVDSDQIKKKSIVKDYRGWKIEPIEGTQVGYALPDSRSIRQRVGIGNSRKITGYEIFYPDGGSKIVNTLQEARRYIDRYEDGESKQLVVLEKGALDTVQAAGRWLAGQWSKLEARYGRKQALAMAVGMLATMPVPGNVAAIVAAAEAVRGLSGFFKEYQAKDLQPQANDRVLDVPDIRQHDYYSCGACSAMAVGRFFGVGPETLEEWKTALGTTEKDSTRPQAIVAYLTSLGLDVMARDGMTLDDLRQAWEQGKAVICPVQDYGPAVPKEAEFRYGHYLTVIYVRPEFVMCQDSSADNVMQADAGSIAEKGRVVISADDWMKNWHDVDAAGDKYVQYGIMVGPPWPEEEKMVTKSNYRDLGRAPKVGESVWILLSLPDKVLRGTISSVSNIDNRGLGNTYCDVRTPEGVKHVSIDRIFDKKPKRVTEEDEYGKVTVWRGLGESAGVVTKGLKAKFRIKVGNEWTFDTPKGQVKFTDPAFDSAYDMMKHTQGYLRDAKRRGVDQMHIQSAEAQLKEAEATCNAIIARETAKLGKYLGGTVKKQAFHPVAAGACVQAADTGRVLMLQRAVQVGSEDGAQGEWEFPGGHIHGREPAISAAIREWQEEVGQHFPDGDKAGEWASSNGKYRGFIIRVPREFDLTDRSAVANPDGDVFEAVAWVAPQDLTARALRAELREDLDRVLEALGV